jgi:hypothetical protein
MLSAGAAFRMIALTGQRKLQRLQKTLDDEKHANAKLFV